jgi:hypothetical protein
VTLDELLVLARDVARNGSECDSPAEQLARAVIALLQPDKPCGWDASFVVEQRDDIIDGPPQLQIHEATTSADEAHWAAVEVLRAVEKAKE